MYITRFLERESQVNRKVGACIILFEPESNPMYLTPVPFRLSVEQILKEIQQLDQNDEANKDDPMFNLNFLIPLPDI